MAMAKKTNFLRGEQLLNNPLLNKGSAFTQEERDAFGLNGLLPFHVSSIQEQVERRYANFLAQPDKISKYIFLSSLQNRNEVLFYRLVQEHITEMLPLIYTPTVGDISMHYSVLYREHRGIYLSYPQKEKIEEIIGNLSNPDISVIVVTDGERILGLGDLGVGGMAIPLGKLSLYTLFGGIHPAKTLPILLDVGTNNELLLKDPLYIGWRHRRIGGEQYDQFVDLFVKAVKKRYPHVLLQWEDFAKPHAKPLLERYRDQICSFNDDIQGTASVVLAALLAGVKITKSRLQEQRIAVFGGGGAGLGICHQLLAAMREEGMEERAARSCFYVIDKDGLIHTQLDNADPEQKKFAQEDAKIASWKVKDPSRISLLDVVKNAHPTILIGVTAQTGAFTEEIIKAMAQYVERPIIFPLSNPNSRCEADPAHLILWTKGKAIIATGSPFDPIRYQEKTYPIPQCNNVYIFPGVGLGTLVSGASKVTDRMFLTAASILSQYAPALKDPYGSLFPPFEELRAVCREIAIAVALMAQSEGVASSCSKEELVRKIDEEIWYPNYEERMK